jgi:DNA-directed RNA polymerase specialized sigma24 family protein
MTTTNNTNARKTGTETATANSRRRRLDAEVDYFNEHFPIDLQTAQSLVEHLTPDEFCYLVGRCGKKKYFTPALLRVLGRANRRRDERLQFLLKDLDGFLPELVASYTSRPEDIKTIMRRVRERVDEYNGPTAAEPFLEWVVPQIAVTLKSADTLRKVEAQNSIAFADLYRRTYRAAFAGAWDILRHCRHLGATPDTARQVVQDTFTKIFLSAEDWRDGGEASLPTRVREYAEWQAMGWRTERIRERRKERRMRGAMRRYGLPVKTKRRHAAE